MLIAAVLFLVITIGMAEYNNRKKKSNGKK
jgi:preprotein translocase subunit SecG